MSFAYTEITPSPAGPTLKSAAMLELVIFGCDGVLVDSERLAIKVDVQVLAQLGCPMAEEEIIE